MGATITEDRRFFGAVLEGENACDEELVSAGDGALTVNQDGLGVKLRLSRREMVRWLLAGAGAGASWPIVAASLPIHTLLADEALFSEAEARMVAADWKPLFLNARQNELLVALSEGIVPGSAKAQVNRFIDLLLGVDTHVHRESFVASLAALESASQERFGHSFATLTEAQKNELLTIASKETEAGHGNNATKEQAEQSLPLHDHFENLKGWISGAYYSSEPGMKELGWTGDYAFESYPACDHSESHG